MSVVESAHTNTGFKRKKEEVSGNTIKTGLHSLHRRLPVAGLISVFGFRLLGGGGVLFSGKNNRYTPDNKTNQLTQSDEYRLFRYNMLLLLTINNEHGSQQYTC